MTCALGGEAAASMCTSVDWRGSAGELVACGQDGRAHLLQLREARAARAVAVASMLTLRTPLASCRLAYPYGRLGWPTSSRRGLHEPASPTPRSCTPAPTTLLSSGKSHLCCSNACTAADNSLPLLSWDVRAPLAACAFHQKTAHQAGVCAIEVNPHRPFEVATGAAVRRGSGLGRHLTPRRRQLRRPSAPLGCAAAARACVLCGDTVRRRRVACGLAPHGQRGAAGSLHAARLRRHSQCRRGAALRRWCCKRRARLAWLRRGLELPARRPPRRRVLQLLRPLRTCVVPRCCVVSLRFACSGRSDQSASIGKKRDAALTLPCRYSAALSSTPPVPMAPAMHACVHAYAIAPARHAGRGAAVVPSAPARRRRQACLATQASAGSVGAAAAGAKRAFNFSAGPACLPLDVLETAQAEMVDWHGSGMSVLEMSHRGPEFEGIIAKAEKDLRTLMKIPDNYKARARRRGRPNRMHAGVLLCVRAARAARRHARALGAAALLSSRRGARRCGAPWRELKQPPRRLPPRRCFSCRAARPPSLRRCRSTSRPRAPPWTTWSPARGVPSAWAAEAAAAAPVGFRAALLMSARASQGRRGGCQVQQGQHRGHGQARQVHRCGHQEGSKSRARQRVLTGPLHCADIPAQSSWNLTPNAAYVHICANETIGGVEFKVRTPSRLACAL